MMQSRTLRILAAALVLAAAALACGGSEAVTMDDIGVYPGVAPVEEGNFFAETLAESVKESAGREDVNVEVRMYNLPGGTGWEEVKLFYVTEANADGWEESGDLTSETDFVSTIGWTRGGLFSPQAFVIAYSLDPLGGPPILLQLLFSD